MGSPVELAREVDVLVVSAAGGDGTRHLVSHEVIEALGADGYLVNIARGDGGADVAQPGQLSEVRGTGYTCADAVACRRFPLMMRIKMVGCISRLGGSMRCTVRRNVSVSTMSSAAAAITLSTYQLRSRFGTDRQSSAAKAAKSLIRLACQMGRNFLVVARKYRRLKSSALPPAKQSRRAIACNAAEVMPWP